MLMNDKKHTQKLCFDKISGFPKNSYDVRKNNCKNNFYQLVQYIFINKGLSLKMDKNSLFAK